MYQFTLAPTAAALGVANHLYFKRYELLRTNVIHTALVLFFQPGLFALLQVLPSSTSKLSLSTILISYLLFFASLASSIVLYRISPLHPLANIPGPLIFKTTNLWRVYICWSGLQHHTLKALHDQYGSIVRTGPNEISIINGEAVKSILGSDGLPKGPAYLAGKVAGQPSALMDTKGEDRIRRRRIWSRGFTSEEMKEYQQIIARKAGQLGEALASRSEVDLFEWHNFFS
ncbi:hypothetical protein V5O48_005438 [Marasmius crinis-equi]|uniref:Uncharacterized protein n=1 Tax=Marasmius crinis-equi TaxID=585013 RepID=A0ABR3FMD5_9AGAR